MNTPRSFVARRRLFAGAVALTLAALLVSGCGLLSYSRHHRSSSVVAFLFPDSQPLIEEPVTPVLKLPLRVGVAFVPDESSTPDRFSQGRRQVLLEQVAEQFKALPFVHSIQTVPELYLRRGGGFENLDQVRAMLGIDVIVLLSYDQSQFTSERTSALAYWTLVGAYIVEGNRNDTHTLMEATVYDIGSRSLLFRAPGADLTRGDSSLAQLEASMRASSAASLGRATENLVANLDMELTRFRVSVREGVAPVKVEHRPGYSGAGAVDWIFVIGTMAVLGGASWRRRRGALGDDG